jgi:hypothetical protein
MSLTRIMWRRLQLWLARRLLVMATRMANNVETHPGQMPSGSDDALKRQCVLSSRLGALRQAFT